MAQVKQDLSISVSPSILEIEAKKPSIPTAQITIQNRSEKDVILGITLKPFTQDGLGNGQVKYLPATEAKQKLARVESKIKIYNGDTPVSKLKLITLESKTLDLRIDVDNDFPQGDYYFTVLFSSDTSGSTSKSQVSASGGIGTHIILSVSNTTVPTGAIVEFSSPFFISRGPVPFKLLVENNSTHYAIPRGHIEVKNILGGKTSTVDILPQYLLSDSKRYLIDNSKLGLSTMQVIWPEKFLLGIYKATAVVKFSEGPRSENSSIYIVSLPILPISIFTGLSFIVVGVLFKVKKKINKTKINRT